MRKSKRSLSILLTITALAVMILDAKTAIQGVKQGIDLCHKTLIPALFPFLIITSSCSSLMLGLRSRILRTLLRPCKLPNGTEIIFIVGLLGGYPVGAKLISDAYDDGQITNQDAQRMLMFCSNAGPSFIFGILGSMFSEKWIPWVIWSVHILSAYLVGVLTATTPGKHHAPAQAKDFQFTQAITGSMKSMGNICTWVILFRIVLVFLNKWFLWRFPDSIRTLMAGILELSNGCTLIWLIKSTEVRFIISLLIVTFGGLCVAMQTASIAPKLSIKPYLIGKFFQCIIALILSVPIIILATQISLWPSLLMFAGLLFIAFILTGNYVKKKVVAFSKQMLYNTEKR